MVFLDISLIKGEMKHSAEEHSKIIKSVLSVYRRRASHVVALIGDNASTKRAFGRFIGPIYVGSYSHRYHLAIKEFVSHHQPVIGKVQKIMGKRSCTIASEQLRRVIRPRHILANVTK